MNIFYITRPQENICWVTSYVDDMSSLIIGAREAGKSFRTAVFLHFLGVHYFEGSMQWVGANFQIGSIGERNDLMLSYTAWPPDIIVPQDTLISVRDDETLIASFEPSSLYKVQSLQGFEIKIIANQAHKTSTMPKF